MKPSLLLLGALAGSVLLAPTAVAQTPQSPLQPFTGTVRATPVPPAGPDLAAPPRHMVESDHKRGGYVDAPIGPANALRSVPVELATLEPLGGAAEAKQDFVETAVIGSGSRSTVGEPSATMADASNGFYTGNHHAARTTDGGSNWTGVNPATRFGSGFCCDQRVITHPSGVSIWLLQYSNGSGPDTHKLAVAETPAALGSNTFARSFDFAATNFGITGDLDFPDVAVAGDFFYFASNVFGASFNAVVYRIRAADFLTGNVSFSFFRATNPGGGGLGGGSYRFTQTAIDTDTMYFAEHRNTSRIALFRWGPSGLSIFERDVPQWSASNYVDTCPDGVDWLSRADSRITGGYQTLEEVGFMWTSSAVGNITRPHVRVARFKKSDLSLIRVQTLNFGDTSLAYPAVAPNIAGHLGITLAMGGGTRFPSYCTALVDDIQNFQRGLTITIERSGDDTPAVAADGEARFGDYFTVTTAPHSDRMTFIGTGLAQRGGSGGSNSEPRFQHWGRAAFQPNAGPLNFAGLIVKSEPAGVPIDMTPFDFLGGAGDTTPFYRKFVAGTASIQLTAPAQFTDGNGQLFRFVRWRTKSVPDEDLSFASRPVGQRTFIISDIGSFSDICVADYEEASRANAERYGVACPPSGAFYELFDTGSPFDLANKGIILTPERSGGWQVAVDPSPFLDQRIANNLNLGDDVLAAGVSLGFAVNIPGAGSVSTVDVDSNGRLGWGLSSSDFSESVGEFLAENMLAVVWDDLNPSAAVAGGGVYFDQTPQYTMCTWLRVPEFNTSNENTVQVRFFRSGIIEVSWRDVASTDSLVGFSTGLSARDPGGMNLGAFASFITGPGQTEMILNSAALPILGQASNFQVFDAPASTQFGVVNLGLSAANLPLAAIGAPGCSGYVGNQLDGLPFAGPGGSTITVPFAIPNNLDFLGLELFAQALAVAPGTNVLGLAASNGQKLTLGNLP